MHRVGCKAVLPETCGQLICHLLLAYEHQYLVIFRTLERIRDMALEEYPLLCILLLPIPTSIVDHYHSLLNTLAGLVLCTSDAAVSSSLLGLAARDSDGPLAVWVAELKGQLLDSVTPCCREE
mmetsp:Transcript_78149/g.211388  ORF Transcript_78149/g.211388 Transcript_78149/m.211388 type:complete len:123 (+) Transcript_78149:157-525(+)